MQHWSENSIHLKALKFEDSRPIKYASCKIVALQAVHQRKKHIGTDWVLHHWDYTSTQSTELLTIGKFCWNLGVGDIWRVVHTWWDVGIYEDLIQYIGSGVIWELGQWVQCVYVGVKSWCGKGHEWIMPPTQRKLTSFPVSKKPLKFQGSTQKRLEELKKVVSIKGGSVNFDIEELAIAKAVIESEDSSSEELLESLRRLSCFQITGEMLRSSGVGYSIRYVHSL